MKNHPKRPSAAHEAEPDPGSLHDDWDSLPERWRNWDPVDPDAIPPWDDPVDPDAEPMPEPFRPPLHPPEMTCFPVGGIVAEPEVSGFYYLSGKPVPPTHPDHGPMHLLPRWPNGGFAAYYYCSKAELELWGLHHPPPLRFRHDGFTPEKIAIFIRTLRATASVTDAARAAVRKIADEVQE